MNVDLIKNKLNELSAPKGGNSNKKDEKALSFWKPTIGKQLVRFVPSKTIQTIHLQNYISIMGLEKEQLFHH
jgi:hypothetical protein